MNEREKNMMQVKDVPYIVFEGEQARSERHVKRLWIAVIIAIIILLITNVLWLFAWLQYDYIGQEVDVNSDSGVANYIGRNGDITNGTDSSENKSTSKEEW